MNKIIRVSSKTDRLIDEIQLMIGSTKPEIVQTAIARLHAHILLTEANKAFQKLKDDPITWKKELAEREEWESLS